MSKPKKVTYDLYPSEKDREAAINQAKFLIPMRLYAREYVAGSHIVLTNDINFKEFQTALDLGEIYINSNSPTILLSKSAFISAIHRAKEAGHIFALKSSESRAGIYDHNARYTLGLTPKGRRAMEGEIRKLVKLNDGALSRDKIIKAQM